MPDFDRVPRYAKGYRVEQVDAFLARVDAGEVTANQVRTVGFDLVRGGYDVQAVDADLDRLEDQLGRDERRAARNQLGEQAFVRQVTTQAQALRARLAREHGDRFARVSGLGAGYDIADVDELCDQIGDYLDGEQPLSVEALRAAVFRVRRGSRAYSEQPVDAFLDRVVAVMTRVS
ncbi:MAG TPA: DivIVA domain-containing protein [Actinomycetales bacterium]